MQGQNVCKYILLLCISVNEVFEGNERLVLLFIAPVRLINIIFNIFYTLVWNIAWKKRKKLNFYCFI